MVFERAERTTKWHRVLTGLIILGGTIFFLRQSITERAHSASHRSDNVESIQARGNVQRGVWEIIHFIPASEKNLPEFLLTRSPMPGVNETIYWLEGIPPSDASLRKKGYHTSIFKNCRSFSLPANQNKPIVMVAGPNGSIDYIGEHLSGPNWLQTEFLEITVLKEAIRAKRASLSPQPREQIIETKLTSL